MPVQQPCRIPIRGCRGETQEPVLPDWWRGYGQAVVCASYLSAPAQASRYVRFPSHITGNWTMLPPVHRQAVLMQATGIARARSRRCGKGHDFSFVDAGPRRSSAPPSVGISCAWTSGHGVCHQMSEVEHSNPVLETSVSRARGFGNRLNQPPDDWPPGRLAPRTIGPSETVSSRVQCTQSCQ